MPPPTKRAIMKKLNETEREVRVRSFTPAPKVLHGNL
jgi:hypothetical protein